MADDKEVDSVGWEDGNAHYGMENHLVNCGLLLLGWLISYLMNIYLQGKRVENRTLIMCTISVGCTWQDL